MNEHRDEPRVTRRQTMAGLGLAGVALVQGARAARGQETAPMPAQPTARFLTTPDLRQAAGLKPGDWVETLGFHTPGDGGGALYQLQTPRDELQANGSDVLATEHELVAVLHAGSHVSYAMFGTASDGESDDGVAIKLAHEYAGRRRLPVINLSGEFWIKQTIGIPITTNVSWGQTIFHIDERYNSKTTPRWIVENDEAPLELTANEPLKAALLGKLKPGVQLIDELAPYANHLFSLQDANDRIGIRAGYQGNRGWAREELFYVEEEGRILGDIAWSFKDLTSIKATPCSDSYLVIEGGGFHYSGDTPEDSSPGYHALGISVKRSRTIIREQWMGLEPGHRDTSLEPRSGLYSLSGVFDVTLENLRAMPWEKNRKPPEVDVKHGTYGLGGARMLNCTFRNITADAGWVSWGVFGTNLNKNFRIEDCRLNRIDVHFHCWNLHIRNCQIGFKGISVTGGGELLIENTTRDGNYFIGFRQDYGAKWDGPIRLTGCTLRPSGNGRVNVLSFKPQNFDYLYPIGHGTSITLEDLRIDYRAAPESKDPCWLLDIAPFSATKDGGRLFFPHQLVFRDIIVEGREQGVRLLRIPEPYHYDLRHDGGCDDSGLRANCTLVCERVQLERTTAEKPGDAGAAHLVLGGGKATEYDDARALYPKLIFIDCEQVDLWLGECAASVFCERCGVNTITAHHLRGELSFTGCRLRPEVKEAEGTFYEVESTLGTRFTNCTLHAPLVAGQPAPELLNQNGILELNGAVKYWHLNTGLGPDVLGYLKAHGLELTPEFTGQLRVRSELAE